VPACVPGRDHAHTIEPALRNGVVLGNDEAREPLPVVDLVLGWAALAACRHGRSGGALRRRSAVGRRIQGRPLGGLVGSASARGEDHARCQDRTPDPAASDQTLSMLLAVRSQRDTALDATAARSTNTGDSLIADPPRTSAPANLRRMVPHLFRKLRDKSGESGMTPGDCGIREGGLLLA